jgi:hypothetical protein
VRTVEKNARYLRREDFSEDPEFVAMDLSFISALKVLPAVKGFLGTGRLVCLLKPQFEAGRGEVGKRGVIRDPARHEAVLLRLLEEARKLGFAGRGLIGSSTRGQKGNREFLVWCELDRDAALPPQDAPGSWRSSMKRKIKRAGIVVKPHAAGTEKTLRSVIQYLQAKRITPVLEDAAARKLLRKGGVSRDELPGQVDLVIVLGGDGTLLSVAHLAAVAGVPVVGVNLGRLAFLTEIPTDELFITLDAPRRRRKHRPPAAPAPGGLPGKTYLCLNDVVINKGAMADDPDGIQIDGGSRRLKSDG